MKQTKNNKKVIFDNRDKVIRRGFYTPNIGKNRFALIYLRHDSNTLYSFILHRSSLFKYISVYLQKFLALFLNFG